jgi:hypothetical protein
MICSTTFGDEIKAIESSKPTLGCNSGIKIMVRNLLLETFRLAENINPRNFQNKNIQIKLIEWLSLLRVKLCLQFSTYFMTIEIYLRVLSKLKSTMNNLEHQLIFTAVLNIAIKYEEVEKIDLNDFVDIISNKQFTKKQIIDCELFILKKLNFRITPSVFVDLVQKLYEKFYEKFYADYDESNDITNYNILGMSHTIYTLYEQTFNDLVLIDNINVCEYYLALVIYVLQIYNLTKVKNLIEEVYPFVNIRKENIKEIIISISEYNSNL